MKNLGVKTRAIVFVGLGAATILLCHIFPNAATNPETGMVMWLPESIPGSDGREIPISEEEKKNLPSDTTILRRTYLELGYSEDWATYRQLTASLVLMGSDRRSLHEPEFCLRGLGWQLSPGRVVRVETRKGPLEVMELELKRWLRRADGSLVRDAQGNKIRIRGYYYYWWVAKSDSTPHSKVRIARAALNSMFRNVNDRWGYPSVQVLIDPRLPAEEGSAEARKRAQEFIAAYAPEFQKSLGAEERAVEDGAEE